MSVEDQIRMRIEAILNNDARNLEEIQANLDGEVEDSDPFEEERNLYQRIINNYRNALNQSHTLLEENIGFLSLLRLVIQRIKGKSDLNETCALIVDSILKGIGAEYCSIVFFEDNDRSKIRICLESISEDHQFQRMVDGECSLGSDGFHALIAPLWSGQIDFLDLPDVYSTPRLNTLDFPSVVRSLVCFSIKLTSEPMGVLILSHSQPRFFQENHVRFLKILAESIAHFSSLAIGNPPAPLGESTKNDTHGAPVDDSFSIVLMVVERRDATGRKNGVDRALVRKIRGVIQGSLTMGESVVFHKPDELLVVLPGTSADMLPNRVLWLRSIFDEWKSRQGAMAQKLRLNVGFATCEHAEDLASVLESAGLLVQQDLVAI